MKHPYDLRGATPMDKFLSINEVAERLSVNHKLIYKLVNAGKLKAIKVGRILRIPEPAIEAYIESITVKKPAAKLPPVSQSPNPKPCKPIVLKGGYRFLKP
jgi:excisionase family DNA binding protein